MPPSDPIAGMGRDELERELCDQRTEVRELRAATRELTDERDRCLARVKELEQRLDRIRAISNEGLPGADHAAPPLSTAANRVDQGKPGLAPPAGETGPLFNVVVALMRWAWGAGPGPLHHIAGDEPLERLYNDAVRWHRSLPREVSDALYLALEHDNSDAIAKAVDAALRGFRG